MLVLQFLPCRVEDRPAVDFTSHCGKLSSAMLLPNLDHDIVLASTQFLPNFGTDHNAAQSSRSFSTALLPSRSFPNYTPHPRVFIWPQTCRDEENFSPSRNLHLNFCDNNTASFSLKSVTSTTNYSPEFSFSHLQLRPAKDVSQELDRWELNNQ